MEVKELAAIIANYSERWASREGKPNA
jgi:hypothetical protein